MGTQHEHEGDCMTRKECFAALGLNEGADLDEIKRAYRKLAFSLHPDLNPDVPDAAKRFQRVNEAYVLLSRPENAAAFRSSSRSSSRTSAEEASARAREEAKKAYSKAKQGQEFSYSATQQAQQANDDKEDVLKDILNDPFARRVFEDIYSHIQEERSQGKKGSAKRKSGGPASADGKKAANGDAPGWTSVPEFGVERGAQAQAQNVREGKPSVVGKLTGWLRRQIDDEQVLRLPGESLIPGARVRLQIQHGLSGEPQVIELTLPPEFVPGKTMRLKGMGKRVGNWRGDLYVRIEPA